MEFNELSIESQQALRELHEGRTVQLPSKSMTKELFDAGYIAYHPYMFTAYGLTEKTRELFDSWLNKDVAPFSTHQDK